MEIWDLARKMKADGSGSRETDDEFWQRIANIVIAENDVKETMKLVRWGAGFYGMPTEDFEGNMNGWTPLRNVVDKED